MSIQPSWPRQALESYIQGLSLGLQTRPQLILCMLPLKYLSVYRLNSIISDYDKLYFNAIQAQSMFISRANLLCSKRKLPLLDIAESHSWLEVEKSVSKACEALEALSSKDKERVPGSTGKLKQAFRKLCSNAGAGTTLTNLVPTDSYCSVLCGGLKIIFKALEETGRYREEVYNALEELPFILNDNASFVGLNFTDVDLHTRVAAMYAAVYGLMEVIVDWFLKPSFGKLLHASSAGVLLLTSYS